jgi:two-component system, OmpR family, sensor histidine kinase BasS
MISMRRRLLFMLALILLVITQLASAFWLWHESREQISFLVDETLSRESARTRACRHGDRARR